jgi:hypothetical protein
VVPQRLAGTTNASGAIAGSFAIAFEVCIEGRIRTASNLWVALPLAAYLPLDRPSKNLVVAALLDNQAVAL